MTTSIYTHSDDLPEAVAMYVAAKMAFYQTTREAMFQALGSEFTPNVDTLPDTVTLYRGTVEDEWAYDCVDPVSWTADRGVAQWFALRNEQRTGSNGIIHEMVVPKELILYVVGGYEREVILNTRHPEFRTHYENSTWEYVEDIEFQSVYKMQSIKD